MKASTHGLVTDIQVAVYYLLTVQSVGGHARPQDRVQRCNYYRVKDGQLVQIPPDKTTGRVVLLADNDGKSTDFVYLKHLVNLSGFDVPELAPGDALDTSATLFSAVASDQSGVTQAETFLANLSSDASNPGVMLPVSPQGPGRGLILVFTENATADGIVGLRASLDPEIKGNA